VSARERVLAMMRAIEREMHADIEQIDWMSETTKTRALEKLANMGEKVGYPDSWLDYSNVKIVRGDALGNATRAADFAFTHEIRKIGKPSARGEWGATPPTNNSYYDDQAVDVSRRPPSAPELRPERRRCGQLRQSRRADRARVDAWFRQ
jgi:putative endopeptidase